MDLAPLSESPSNARPERPPLIKWQRPNLAVLYGLTPPMLGAIYFFGWRALALLVVVCGAGFVTEWLFTRSRGEPVSSAVFVTAALLTLTLPPTIPFWMAAVGAVAGIAFGKELFGGFGRNVFNPALVGRAFIFFAFPVAMTGTWVGPLSPPVGGLTQWASDAVTGATPLILFRTHEAPVRLGHLFFGNVGGCLGETSALLILIGGGYLVYRKTANRQTVFSCLIGAALMSAALHFAGVPTMPNPLHAMCAGSLLLGAFFMATDPVSSPTTPAARWTYGFLIGVLTMVLRAFSNFPEGVMFSILLMNMFGPLMDQAVRGLRTQKKANVTA